MNKADLSKLTFFAVLGEFAFSWALTERFLDIFARIIYIYYGGEKVEPELSKSLNLKIKYIRKAAKEISEIAYMKDDLISFADQLDAEKDIRHDIIHGAANKGPLNPDDIFEGVSMSRYLHHNTFEEKQFMVTPDFITEQTSKIKTGPMATAGKILQLIMQNADKLDATNAAILDANSVGSIS